MSPNTLLRQGISVWTALLLLVTGVTFAPADAFVPRPSASASLTTAQRHSLPGRLSDHLSKRGLSPWQLSVAMPLDPSAADVSTTTADDSAANNNRNPKVGILLLNLGGPEKLDDVEGFLYNLFADPDIIRLPAPLAPLQPLIAWFISSRRAPQSRKAYAKIGGGSPILQYSQSQADLLLQDLKTRHGIQNAKCYIGMRYWHPYTEEALEQIRKDGVEALVILPLYPQFSISTSGSSLRVLQEVFSRDKKAAPPFHTVVPSWYDRPGYVQAVADLLQAELDQITDEEVASQKEESPQLAGKHILFSAHGVPASYIEAGDPYQEQMIKCVAAIGEEVQSRNPANTVEMHLSYQSRVGPVEWLRPYTDDVIPELGASGIRNLVVVPISFVSEHIETLEEIDMEYRELAEKSGITNWHRCPALNTHPGFVADLADLVHEALEEPTMTVTEACIANSVENLVMDESQSGVVGINTAGVQNVLGAEGEFGSFLL